MKKKGMPNRRIKVKGHTLEVITPEHPFSDATPEERVKEQVEMLANGGIHPAWFEVTAKDVQKELDKDKLN
ncbi:MAG: hypothetical protein WCP15_01275 [bacterium]